MEIEQEIIAAVLAGDSAAFEQLVRECADPIYRYVRMIVKDGHAAEDVAQRVFLSVYQKLHQFDAARGTFSTWAYRIARNAQSRRNIRSDNVQIITGISNAVKTSATLLGSGIRYK